MDDVAGGVAGGWKRWLRAVSAGRVVAATAAAAVAGAALVAVPALPATAVQSPTACGPAVALVNSGFEQPVVPGDNWQQRTEDQVPGWKTTASDNLIEIWHVPFGGFLPASGSQFAELNATKASTLYQDVVTVPGQALRWELQHRGRKGVDKMRVKIGPPGGPEVDQGDLSDGNTAWGTHSGTYTVPAGQTTTRFAFEAVSAAGKVTEGNFLDSISFGTGACVVTTTTASPASGTAVDVGDVLTYTVTAANGGGNPAQGSVITDALPAGTTFVPGSIRTLTGTAATAVTDAAGDDTGGYDAATRTVAVRVGAGATASAGGAVPAAESRSISYQVRVDRAAATTTLVDDATTTSTDPLSGTTSTSTSDAVSHPVAAAADLTATARQVSAAVVAGQQVQYEVTVANTGPQAATASRVALQVPTGLTGTALTWPGGTCPVTGTTTTCTLGTLAPGARETLTLTGSVPAQTPPGTQTTFSVAASSALHDPTPADATASVTSSATASADLAVALVNSAGPVAGADVTYTATITNHGPSTARGITLSDPLFATATSRATFRSASGGSCTVTSTNTVECSVPDLAPGAATDVAIRVGLPPDGGGAVNNAVSVSAVTPDPDTTDNHAAVAAVGATRADLSVDLSLARTTARVGETVPFTLVLRNDGPSTATNVSFNTVVPAGVTVVRAASPYCTPTACTLPALPSGAVVTLTGDAVVGPDAEEGPHRATTTVVSPTPDDDRADNTDTVDFEFVLESDLALTQAVAAPGGGDLVAGEAVRTTLTVTNPGPTRAEGVTLRQVVPAGQPVPATTTGAGACAFSGAQSGGLATAGGTLVCTREALPVGASWSVVLDAPLAADHEDTFTRTTVLTSASPDPGPGTGAVTTGVPVVRRAGLSVTATRTSAGVAAGETVQYSATAVNAGPSDAPAATLTVQLPAELTGAAVSASGGSCAVTAGTATCDLGALPVRGTATLTVSGALPADTLPGTRQALTVSVASAAQDTDTADNTASVSDAVTAAADLSVALAHSAAPTAGGDVTYTATVTNDGPALARGIVLSDPIVTGSTYRSASVPGGSCAQVSVPGSQTVECSLPDLAAGTSVDVTVVLRLSSSDGGSVNNAVSVSGTTPDPDATDNHAAVTSAGSVLADIGVDLSLGASTAQPGDAVPFVLTVVNNGLATATNVSFRTVVPAGMTIVRDSNPYCTSTACTLPWLLPTTAPFSVPSGGYPAGYVPPQGVVVITGTALVGADVEQGRGRASTTVISPTADSSPANNTDTVDFDVLLAADLAVSHTVAGTGGPVVAGEGVESTISVTNAGPTRAEGITLRQPVPAGEPVPVSATSVGTCAFHGDVTAEGVTAGGGTYDCALDALAAHATWSVVLSTAVSATSTAASFTRTATVTAASRDPRALNDSVTTSVPVLLVADLAVTITTDTPRVLRGAAVRFHVEVANAGPSAAGSVVVRHAAAAGTSVTGGTATAGTFDPATGEWRVPLLAVGATAALDLVGAATGAGTGASTASLFSATSTDPDPSDDSASVPVEVTAPPAPRPSLAITTTALPTPSPSPQSVRTAAGSPRLLLAADAAVGVAAGSTVRYSYLVTNDGTVAMSGVSVADDLVGAAACPRTELEVGASMTCTSVAGYLVTQADVDGGARIANTARVLGRAPGAAPALSFGPVSAPVPVVEAAPAVAAAQSLAWDDADRDGTPDAGETLVWRVVVTNTGNVTLTNPVVTGLPVPVTCPPVSLPPGGTTTCVSAAYPLTAADAAAGGVRSDVLDVVTGGPRGGAEVTVTSSLTPSLTPQDPGTGTGGGGSGGGGAGGGGSGGGGTGGAGGGGGTGGTGGGGSGGTGGSGSGGSSSSGSSGGAGSSGGGPAGATGATAGAASGGNSRPGPATAADRPAAVGASGHRDGSRAGALALTGAEAFRTLGLGLLLVAAGLVVLRAGHRRRER